LFELHKGNFPYGSIHDDAEGAMLIVLKDQDDRVMERGIPPSSVTTTRSWPTIGSFSGASVGLAAAQPTIAASAAAGPAIRPCLSDQKTICHQHKAPE
jgi:hypothetical protein